MQGKQGNLGVVEDGACSLVALLGIGWRGVRLVAKVADFECL